MPLNVLLYFWILGIDIYPQDNFKTKEILSWVEYPCVQSQADEVSCSKTPLKRCSTTAGIETLRSQDISA